MPAYARGTLGIIRPFVTMTDLEGSINCCIPGVIAYGASDAQGAALMSKA